MIFHKIPNTLKVLIVLSAIPLGMLVYDPSIFAGGNDIEEKKRINDEVQERALEEKRADADAFDRLRAEKAQEDRAEEKRRLDRQLDEKRYQNRH